MNESWKSDPRLHGMDSRKLALLTRFAADLEQAPQNQKMNTFLSLNKQAMEQGLSFSQDETSLLISILTEGLSPEEKKKVQMIQNLAGQMRRQK